MIIAYDRSGTKKEYLKDLLDPTGIPYDITTSISATLVKKLHPTSIVWINDDEISKEEQEFFSAPSREFLLIVLSKEPLELPDTIRYSSEHIITNSDPVSEVRKRLRQALTNHRVRRLKDLNEMSIYLSKNGLYPGNVYFTEPEYADKFLEILLAKEVDKDKILVVSRFNLALELPEALNENNFIWVTDSIGTQRNRPVNLTFIVENITRKILEGKATIVMIDLFDFLLVYHSFQEIGKAFEQIKSAAMEKNCYLMIVLSMNTMESIQYGQITRYGLNWKPPEND
ncbi:MAG: DUF835 domain-containing protein [Candidatus Thermoplasmatota archaeon]|nr:DUF835 domain-containing protein [Candidatus Thermoplasmatota archaeon]